jgi:uncharacterized protein GlcG (DUF336 family)
MTLSRLRDPWSPRRRLQVERLERRDLLAADALPDGQEWLDAINFIPADDASEVGPIAYRNDDSGEAGSLASYLNGGPLDDGAADAVLTAADDSGPTPARRNPVNPADVDMSGQVTPRDALLVINHLNYGDPSIAPEGSDSAPGVFATDVNGDGTITAADADEVFAQLGLPTLMAAATALASEGEPPPVGALPPVPIPSGDAGVFVITPAEVETLLARAAGATASQDAVIAIVDRTGRILGVRTEQGVLTNIPDNATQVFAIDGAVAKARTAAFFANNQAPLTSRTIRSLSQSTITEREVESNPTVPSPGNPAQNPFVDANPISRTFGPGLVAPVGVGGHFPPDINNTPPVDLFNIELQSRDSLGRPGADGIKGTGDDVVLTNRFNVPTAFLPQGDVPAPESYGVQSGRLPQALGRGLATMPGGIPLYKSIPDPALNTPFTLVGGIGVFFPGIDGYATFEQGFVPNVGQTSTQRLNSAKALEAEYMAIAAAGGVTGVRPIGTIDGVPPPPGYVLPFGRIDLVGITLEIYGPNPTAANHSPGIDTVINYGRSLGTGSSTTGDNQMVLPGGSTAIAGIPLPEGWIVSPHDSPLAGANQLKQADVVRIVNQSITEANLDRAAIRLDVSKNPPTAGPRTKMVIAVADKAGNVLGLFRMHDATVFALDVAVAKARNTVYYADPVALQNADKVDDDLLVARGAVTVAQLNALKYKNNNGAVGSPDLFTNDKSTVRYVPATGLAFTNRTFRFLAEPRYPSGVDGSLPPVFSILTDPGINRRTAENISQVNPTPASQFTSVMGFDAFHTSRNFHDPGDPITPAPGVNTNPLANQNGIVFFPGSTPVYKSQILVGGFGISGDGVDQDDVVTFSGSQGYVAPANLRADMVFYRGVRLPFQKFNRNPRA